MRPYVTVLTENPGDRHKDKGCFFWPICDICLVANLVQSAFSTSLLSDLRDWEDPSCLFLATGSCAFVGFWVWVWFAKRILSPRQFRFVISPVSGIFCPVIEIRTISQTNRVLRKQLKMKYNNYKLPRKSPIHSVQSLKGIALIKDKIKSGFEYLNPVAVPIKNGQ